MRDKNFPKAHRYKLPKGEKYATCKNGECFVFTPSASGERLYSQARHKHQFTCVAIEDLTTLRDVIICSRCECIAARYVDVKYPIYDDFTLCESCKEELDVMTKIMEESIRNKNK